jgi:chromosome segregation ATPase
MSSFIKWTQSTIDKFDLIASKALNLSVDGESEEAELEITRLNEEIKTIKSVANSQMRDLNEKQTEELKSKKKEFSLIRSELKALTETNHVLKEHLRNADGKLSRLMRVNEELTSKLDLDQDNPDLNSVEGSEYQINLLNEKIKRLAGLLKAEKLKTVDALNEKNHICNLIEQEEKKELEKIEELEKELDSLKKESVEIKEMIEKKPRISENCQSLNELSDKLQGKQRMIEVLLSEKSALVLQLENEVRVR